MKVHIFANVFSEIGERGINLSGAIYNIIKSLIIILINLTILINLATLITLLNVVIQQTLVS